MRISDYKCTNKECNHIFDYAKDEDLEGFPPILECEKCGCDARRVWGIASFEVAPGKVGNAKNGYSTSSVSHCSEFGRFKGTKIKKEKIDG